MVSTRPSPSPLKGRISYPTAATYTPGDDNQAPELSAPVQPSSSRDSDRERSQQGLKTWWKGFRDRAEFPDERRVFGVALAESIQYASVQISTAGSDGKLYVWGVIPVVVAKCGLYLKEHATEVEGAFRISGSARRMRELQMIFDTGPRYGKNIDWKSLSYSPHDVATIFRRFLTQAPESVIPSDFYDEFRAVLSGEAAVEDGIQRYKELIRALPPINQYLLLYVLDLLSVFSRKSDKNLMTAPNLALIFQPGVLSHPVHSLRPREHVLSQQVLEFLIEHQDHFLIGMQLTSKDDPEAEPVKPLPTAKPSKPVAVKVEPNYMLPSDSDEDAPAGGYYIVEGNRKPITTTRPRSKSHHKSRKPPVEDTVVRQQMAVSDSDEEAPPGGYEVRVSPEALNREARNLVSGNGNGSGKDLRRRKTVPSKRVTGIGKRLIGAKEAP